jgi:diadenosine tetraphosphate (Ap4A) HIT family hydrolase
MQRDIVDIEGSKRTIGCLGCALMAGEVKNRGGSIAVSVHFDAHQDYEIPIPGFIIIASKRHMDSIDEFTEEERADFIEFLYRIRTTMRQACGIEIVYMHQEEDTSHHFHVWLYPRQDELVELFGKKITSVRPIMEYAREHWKTPERLANIDECVERMKRYYSESFPS